jgi:hypothetical protein
MIGDLGAATLITLFTFLALIMTGVQTIINPVFIFFDYYLPNVFESVRWHPCSIGACFGGENGCDIISTMTNYECNEPIGTCIGVCFAWIVFFFIVINMKTVR